MPIDASIPLQQRQPESLLQTLGTIYALKQQQQEGQLRGLQVQQLNNQLQDQQSLAQAYRNNVTSGPNGPQLNQSGFMGDVLQHAPRIYPQVVQSQMELQKGQLGLQQAQLANAAAHTNFVAQHVQGILNAPPDQKQTAYTASRNQMIQQGVLQPGSPEDPGPVYPGDDAIQRLQYQTMSAKDVIASKQKDLENQLSQLTLQNTMRHQGVTEQETARHDAAQEAYQRGELGLRGKQVGLEAQRNNIEMQRLGMEYGLTGGGNPNLKGDAYLQSLPVPMQQTVKSIANGDIPMPSATRGAGGMVRNAVLMYDPTYTQARYTGKQDFKTGADAQTVKQTSAMLEHLDRSLENSAKLGTSPALMTGLSTPASAAYTKDIQFYTGEVNKLITNGNVTEGEGKALLGGLSSPIQATRDKALHEMLNLTKGNIASSVFQKYKTATGQDFPADQFYDKDTLGRMQKYGITPGGSSAQVITHRYNPATGKIEAVK